MPILSLRTQLKKIGEPNEGKPVPAIPSGFYSAPQSLKAAMISMDAPLSEDWSQVSDIFHDEAWTDEVQGVDWDGSHWIFSANANQDKPTGHNDKSIYVFEGGSDLKDDHWLSRLKYMNVPHPISGTSEPDDHWGQLCCYNGLVYVSHFWEGGPKKGETNVVVFKNNGGFLEFYKWIELEKPTSPTDGQSAYAEFQAINPWDGMFYTCFGKDTIYEFFIHDPESGKYTGKTFKFDIPITKVQGACFSPNGHLYVATNATLPENDKYQTIWYYSALNGRRLGVIAVKAEEGIPDNELEGICYANFSFPDGRTAQIHAVLLENKVISDDLDLISPITFLLGGVPNDFQVALDNIFFKSFSSAKPDIV
jgi:hypothetical protein